MSGDARVAFSKGVIELGEEQGEDIAGIESRWQERENRRTYRG